MLSLRVQITLLAGGNATPLDPGQETLQTIAVSGRRMKATLQPAAALVPGGAAVHAHLLFESDQARSLLPPGMLFELWDKGRTGYGTVLG